MEERNKFDETINKSEDTFEKSVTYISGLALLVSMFLNDSKETWALTAAQIYFESALILNLLSHLKASYYSRLSQEEYDDDDQELYNKINERNRNMMVINLITVILLMIGIAFLIVFKSMNI